MSIEWGNAMTRHALAASMVWAAFAALAAAAHAATAEEQFESVYGKEYRAAAVSRERAVRSVSRRQSTRESVTDLLPA